MPASSILVHSCFRVTGRSTRTVFPFAVMVPFTLRVISYEGLVPISPRAVEGPTFML